MPRDAVRLPSRAGALSDLLHLAWPVVLSRLGIMTMGLTDAIVVGNYSARQLGYHALGWAPTMIVVTTSVGLLMGVQVMTARHVGEGRCDAVGGVFRRGLVYAFWIGVASTAVLGLGGPPVLRAIGLERDLAHGASRALVIFSLSLIPYLIACVGQFFLEALGRPKPAMVAMWAANGVNLAANLWLVPGHSGLPVDGAVGSAWATFLARSALALWLLVYVARLADARALGIFAKPIDSRAAAAEQRRIGYGTGASYFIEVSAFSAMTIIAGWLGGLQVAAWSVVLNVAAIIFMAPLGLGAATAVLVGRAYGARDRHGVVLAGKTGFAVTAVLMLVVCALVYVGAPVIASVYSRDPGLIAIAAPALVLSCLFFVADGLQVVGAQALRARGDIWLPTTIHLTAYAVVMMPLGWFLAHPVGLGVNGIVWAVIVASLISASLFIGRFLLLGRRDARAGAAAA
jgi:MATE family multidrug resistance protein